MAKSTFGFFATKGASEMEERFIVAGLANEGHYLNFQRSLPLGGEDDWGVHIEFDDQCNSGYEKVKACSLSRAKLRVEFTEPFDRKQIYNAAEIQLRISDSEYDSFAKGLKAIFAQREQLLNVES